MYFLLLMEQNVRDSKVIKDISEYFNARLAHYLERIDELNDLQVMDKTAILYINNELHKIFKHISAKLDKLEFETQIKYRKAISMLTPIVNRRTQNHNSEEIEQNYSLTKHYRRYVELVERREIHIYKCLERIGLTSREKIKSKLLR